VGTSAISLAMAMPLKEVAVVACTR